MADDRRVIAGVAPNGVERRRGRPPNAVQGSSVMTWLTIPEHDRLIALSKQGRTSISQIIRVALQETVLSDTT